MGNGIRKLMQRAVVDGEDNPQFEHAFAEFQSYYKLHCNDNTKPYPGVMELLAKLKEKGYHLAIVSNKADFAVKELQEIYFKGAVEAAIGEREGVARKPAKDTVMQALHEMGVPAEGAIYVGDSDVDIMTAANAGIPCISVTWGFRDREFLKEHGATRFADNTGELIRLIEEM